jgi:23S rRNA (pseudouridine1915-N3)-methyltransferase
MKIIFVLVGKTTDLWVKNGLETYEQRLRHYADFSTHTLAEGRLNGATAEAVKQAEGETLLRYVGDTDYVVLLDENGTTYTSRQLAAQLQKWLNAAPKRLIFVVGGAFGFSAAVKSRANATISLSALTFTHQMIRPFFAEQLYRAFTILRGEKYHND